MGLYQDSIGKIEAISQNIVDLGFEIKGKALILGLEVSNENNVTDIAVNKIIEKSTPKLTGGHALISVYQAAST